LEVSGQKQSADEDTASKYCETPNNWFKRVTWLLTEIIVKMKRDCVTMSALAAKGETSGSGFKQNKESSYMGIHQAHIKLSC